MTTRTEPNETVDLQLVEPATAGLNRRFQVVHQNGEHWEVHETYAGTYQVTTPNGEPIYTVDLKTVRSRTYVDRDNTHWVCQPAAGLDRHGRLIQLSPQVLAHIANLILHPADIKPHYEAGNREHAKLHEITQTLHRITETQKLAGTNTDEDRRDQIQAELEYLESELADELKLTVDGVRLAVRLYAESNTHLEDILQIVPAVTEDDTADKKNQPPPKKEWGPVSNVS